MFTYVAAVSADGANLYIVNDSDNTLHLHTPEQATYVSNVTIACVINNTYTAETTLMVADAINT